MSTFRQWRNWKKLDASALINVYSKFDEYKIA